jgi:pimeloyl-ACP methyl ester carboxylesterase
MHDYMQLGESGVAWVDAAARNRLAAVFVHGWGGDCEQTWTWRPPRLQRLISRRSVLLFDLLIHEKGLAWDYYSVRHDAKALSLVEIDAVAGLVRQFVESYVRYPAVVFVAHSLGGLAARQAALDLLELQGNARFPIVGLLLLGTPNSGTQLARYWRLALSVSAREMQPLGERLTQINQRWTTRMINGGDPRLSLENRANLLCWNAVGQKDRVVPKSSASSLSFLGDIKTLPGGHRSLPKVSAVTDLAFVLLKDFLAAAAAAAAEKPIHRAAEVLADELRRSSLNAAWTQTEEEHITLWDAGDAGHFQCRIHSQRRGGVAQRTLEVCLRLQALAAPPRNFAFEYSIGQGLLDGKEFGDFARGLASDAVVTQHLVIEEFYVVQNGIQHDYAPDGEPQRGPGWVVLSFSCAGDLREGESYERFELKVRTLVPKGIGWYSYESTRTVLEHLVVSMDAPFSLVCRPRLGEGTDTPRTIGNLSEVSAKGPVPRGSEVDWIFVENEKSDSHPSHS